MVVLHNLLLWAELAAVLVAVAVAFRRPSLFSGTFESFERLAVRIGRRRRSAILIAALWPVALRVALLPVWPAPVPFIHDEWSHLLLADTFAHGRLTNPPHTPYIPLETFHELQRPTYCSIRPVGPALPLAVAQVVTAVPWIGVLLGVALMCGGICWALQQSFPPEWAFAGAVLAGIQYAVVSAWTNTYWGGTVAAFAGAVAFGVASRLRKRITLTGAVVLGLAIGLLVNTRPFEGVLFAAALVVALVIASWLHEKNVPRIVFRLLTPLAVTVALVAAWMLYYNFRTTGNPLETPYQLGLKTYTMAPMFPWQTPRTGITYHHAVMREVYAEWEMKNYRSYLSITGAVRRIGAKYVNFWSFFLRPALTIPALIGFLFLVRGRSRIDVLLVTAATLVTILIELWFNPHYAGHFAVFASFLIVAGLRWLRTYTRHGKPVGLFLSRALTVIPAITLIAAIASIALGYDLGGQTGSGWYLFDLQKSWTNIQRPGIVKALEQKPGRHLVFVRYSPSHWPHDEWVWNGADLNTERIVWARDMPGQNPDLIASLPGRACWLLEPDVAPVRLRSYESAVCGPQTAIRGW